MSKKKKRKVQKKQNEHFEEMITVKYKEKKYQNLFESTLSIFTESSKFLLLLITLVLVVTSSLFVLKISITKFHLPLIIILSIIIFLLLKKEDLKKTLYAIAIGLVVFAASTFVVGKIYDLTADGNTYHKLTIGALKNGWNPIYQDIADFNTEQGNPFDILEDNVNVKWSNHYANGTEQFGAVVYAFTGNIESAKVFNILWVYIGLFILTALFKQMKISSWKSFLVSCTLAFNPISLTHITNLYLDGVLAISLFIIIIIGIIKTLYEEKNKENDLLLAMAIIWCVNAKFTGLAFAAIFSFVLYLYRNIRNYVKDKKIFGEKLLKETLYYIAVVFISVVVVGGSTYTKNLVTHGHPFYPLYGEGHVANMVMMEIPKSMQDDSSLQIFLTSLFAKGENVSPSYAEQINEPELKIPFTTSQEEINNYNIPDIRMGGFGPFFSGIFIITIIGLIIVAINLIKNKEYDKLLVYSILITTTITLVLALDGSYWARYIPYVYLLPTYLLIYLFKIDWQMSKIRNVVGMLIIGIFAINSILILKTQCSHTLSVNGNTKYILEQFKISTEENKTVKIKLNHHGVQGIQYNLDDLGITNYELTEDETLEEQGYMFTY